MQLKTIKKQELVLKDTKKAVRGQNKFFKDIENTEQQFTYSDDIEIHYGQAKGQYKRLKEEFRQIDHVTKEKHENIGKFRVFVFEICCLFMS